MPRGRPEPLGCPRRRCEPSARARRGLSARLQHAARIAVRRGRRADDGAAPGGYGHLPHSGLPLRLPHRHRPRTPCGGAARDATLLRGGGRARVLRRAEVRNMDDLRTLPRLVRLIAGPRTLHHRAVIPQAIGHRPLILRAQLSDGARRTHKTGAAHTTTRHSRDSILPRHARRTCTSSPPPSPPSASTSLSSASAANSPHRARRCGKTTRC